MQAQYKQAGQMIDYTPGSNVALGAVVLLGNFVTIAIRAILANTLGALCTRGVFTALKDNSDIALGDVLYWDADGDPVGGTAGSGAFTKTATDNTFAGFAIAAAGVTAGTVELFLCSLDSSLAEKLTLAQASDVGDLSYTAGMILVADGDSYEEVAVWGDATLASTGALSLADDEKNLTLELVDPGDIGAIPVTSSGHVDLVTAGAETRTLDAPTYVGQILLLSLKTDGGDCVVTCATTVNQNGDNTITLDDAGDAVLLVAKANGADKRWSVVSNDGATLATV